MINYIQRLKLQRLWKWKASEFDFLIAESLEAKNESKNLRSQHEIKIFMQNYSWFCNHIYFNFFVQSLGKNLRNPRNGQS